MYRIIEMSGTLYAIELNSAGRTDSDEFEEMRIFLEEGGTEEIKIVLDYEELGATLVERDYA